MELKKYKLGEILELQRGYDLPSSKMENGSVPVAGSNGIIGYHNVAKIQPPCLTIGRSGSVGKVHFYEEPIWPHNTSLYVKDFKGNDERYVYYLLKNIDLSKLCDSSVVPSLNRNYVYPLEVFFYCDKINQRRIASVLSSLDSKITLNRRINTKLETIAKRLYDYWFVQFDFPDANGNPYKSSGGKMVWNDALKREIPEGWEVKRLGEIISVKDGTHDSPKQQSEGKYLITSKHLTSFGIDFQNAYLISDDDFNEINRRSEVNQSDILFSMIGTIGNKYLVTEKEIDFAIKNMALIKTSENKSIVYFVWQCLESIDYERYEKNAISGSIQKFLSLDSMRNIPIIFNNILIQKFNTMVSDCFRLKANIINETSRLTALRDKLLPLLMNGQVEVA